MNILPIYTYDHPVLRKKLPLVTEITDQIVALAVDMHTTMLNAEGVGLAANQVGREFAIAVVNLKGMTNFPEFTPITMVNPVVVAVSEEEEPYEEGCLSLPNLRAEVWRPAQAQVRYYDLNMGEHTIEADSMLARVMQHEIDHLNGIYFFDHLKPMRRAMLKRKLIDIKRGDVEVEYPLMSNNSKHPSNKS